MKNLLPIAYNNHSLNFARREFPTFLLDDLFFRLSEKIFWDQFRSFSEIVEIISENFFWFENEFLLTEYYA